MSKDYRIYNVYGVPVPGEKRILYATIVALSSEIAKQKCVMLYNRARRSLSDEIVESLEVDLHPYFKDSWPK